MPTVLLSKQMDEQYNIFAILTAVAFIVAFPTALIAWFRMIRAKSHKDYLKNIALFVLPILSVFLLAHLGGLMEFPDMADASPPQVPLAQDIFSKMPTPQLVLLMIAGSIWLIGGNVLFFLHKRRVGKNWWQFMNPLEPPFKDFNGKEWSILIILVVSTFIVAGAAMSFNQPTSPSHNKSAPADAPKARAAERKR